MTKLQTLLALLRGTDRRRLATAAWRTLKQLGPAGLVHEFARFFGRRTAYPRWVKAYDTLAEADRTRIRASVEALARRPLISVLLPTFESKPAWLIEAIESVRAQLYPHWELCVADDASTDPEVGSILRRYANEDARIKVSFRSSNGHISAASNTALELATGEWVGLLDHDDVLSEDALFRIAEAIDRNPDLCLIYSDEDKLDETGARRDPYFKCDWNPDLFYSHNLVSHFGTYRADILKAIGGFREGFEGSQDYDVALRFVERIRPDQIHHVPRVLYHWRVHGQSTSHDADAKPYAMVAGERALNDHFRHLGIAARAELVGYGYRVHYALPASVPLVSLIVPTRNGVRHLRPCIASVLEKTRYRNFEILVIDNGSDDSATLRYLAELGQDRRIRILRDERPFNFAALNNAAVGQARGDLIGLLNDDVEVISPDWLDEMASIALQPGVGVVGARLWFGNRTLQHGGVILGIGESGVAGHAHYRLQMGSFGYFGRASLIQSFSAVSAACLVVRKDRYEAVGGMNEADLPVAYNDVDFCLRLRAAGYRNVWTPYAELYHHESATRGRADTAESQARFAAEVDYMKRRWGTLLANDPAYSPNLTLERTDFGLAWPPRVPRPAATAEDPVESSE
jgi:glycosyltransferase involved in cell wall biosynthesis